MPRAAATSSMRRQVSGAQELAMQITLPRSRRSSRPDCAMISSTCRSVATMTITTSAWPPTCAGERQVFTPSSDALRMASTSMS
jgi:hypothetical protein